MRVSRARARENVTDLGRVQARFEIGGEVKDTILHEIAHALAVARAGHGPAWKTVARRIGATPKAHAEEGEEARAARRSARARFRTGMEASIRTRGGRLHTGVIVRMNPKRASVRCGEAVFLVPHATLEPSVGVARAGGRS